jgi:hypothetical protein
MKSGVKARRVSQVVVEKTWISNGRKLKKENGRKINVQGSEGHGMVLEQGQTHGSTLQQCTNKTLTTDPFGNTCEVGGVSPEVEAGGVTRLRCP